MLHQRGQALKSAAGDTAGLENTLDSLLSENCRRNETPLDAPLEETAKKSVIDSLRDLFGQEVVPQMIELAERYRDKGVGLRFDASDFLGGGRGISVETTYGERRVVLEGTVMPDKIAFARTNYVGNVGGTMASGPSLRTGQLTAKGFADFVLEHIIALVRTNAR